MSEQATLTNTVGYYNGYTHPIQLQITKLGIHLVLQSGEYILDRQGRKVNDPFFDLYVNSGLKKETSHEPVPLVSIPVIDAPVPRDANYSVRGTQNVNPTREAPKVPEPRAAGPRPPASNSSIQGMSVEEARKMGLIKRTREVPEDYGPDDTNSSVPPKPANIKYAVDTVRARRTELPKEVMEEVQKSSAAPLIDQLQKASTQEAAPESTGFLNQVVKNFAPEDSPLVAGTPNDPETDDDEGSDDDADEVKQTVKEVVDESSQVRRLMRDESARGLPEPDLGDAEDDGSDDDVAVDADTGGRGEVASDDADDDEAALSAPVKRRFRRPALKTRFVCPICEKPNKFRSQLVQHAHQSHPDQVQAILAKFPK